MQQERFHISFRKQIQRKGGEPGVQDDNLCIDSAMRC